MAVMVTFLEHISISQKLEMVLYSPCSTTYCQPGELICRRIRLVGRKVSQSKNHLGELNISSFSVRVLHHSSSKVWSQWVQRDVSFDSTSKVTFHSPRNGYIYNILYIFI